MFHSKFPILFEKGDVSPSAYISCIYNSFWSICMVSLVDIAAGDIINTDFMHPHRALKTFLISINVVIQSSMRYVPVKNIQRTSTPTTSSGRTYKINNEDYKKLFLHLQNFSNNKLLYIAILLFPFAECFTSVNKCLTRNLKYGNTHICDFQTFITSFKSK